MIDNWAGLYQTARALTVFIYLLRDPRTNEIRYVGKAVNPTSRLRYHYRDARKTRSQRACWLRSLLNAGLKPVLEIEDEVSVAEWQALEAAYILFFKETGCDLVNGTPGGDGLGIGPENPKFGKPSAMRGKKFSPEACAAVSRGMIGRKLSAATRAAISRSHIGMTSNAKHRAAISKALTGRKLSLEHRAHIGASVSGINHPYFGKPGPMLGKQHSFKTKKKMSQSHLGRIHTAETRAKLSALLSGSNHPKFGKKDSEATRLKKSQSMKLAATKRWARERLERRQRQLKTPSLQAASAPQPSGHSA